MNNFRRRVENSSGVVLNPVTGRGIVDGYEVVDLGLPSGLLWATCNVGATKEEEYGNYYRWSDNLATQVMGEGWRMPTKSEIQELFLNTTYDIDSDTINGISGIKFINMTNPNAYMFIPFTGYYKDGSKNLEYNGERGYAWSSNISDDYYVNVLYVEKRLIYIPASSRWCKMPVRGVHA